MIEIGYIGQVTLEDSIALSVICQNGSSLPTNPDSAPTYTIIDKDGTDLSGETGSMSLTPASETGLRAVLLPVTSANGYAADSLYTFTVSYELSSVAYLVKGTFKVT